MLSNDSIDPGRQTGTPTEGIRGTRSDAIRRRDERWSYPTPRGIARGVCDGENRRRASVSRRRANGNLRRASGSHRPNARSAGSRAPRRDGRRDVIRRRDMIRRRRRDVIRRSITGGAGARPRATTNDIRLSGRSWTRRRKELGPSRRLRAGPGVSKDVLSSLRRRSRRGNPCLGSIYRTKVAHIKGR